MENFFPTVSATFIVNNPKRRGIIELEGFDDIIQSSKINCKDTGLVLYENVNFTDGDIILPITALDDKRMLYSFGKNFGTVTITGAIYNSQPTKIKLGSISKLYDKFNANRVSKHLTTIDLSIDTGFKCKLFVTSFSLTGANPQNHSISFVIEGTVCPVSNKG